MTADASFRAMSGAEPPISDSAQPASGGRVGPIFGALVAVAASIGLAWWLGADDGGLKPAAQSPAAAVSAPPRPLASPLVDEGQVRQAYEQFQALYADGGMDRLWRSSRICADALGDDPRILDFCLALDMYLSTLPPQSAEQRAWFAAGPERRLALARDAMADAEAAPVRIAAIERLTRIAAPRPGFTSPAPRPVAEAPRTAPAAAPRAVTSRPAASEAAAPPRRTTSSSAACRDTTTAPGRLVCATPALQRSHQEMLRAYDRALAAGMDEHRLNRAQARWRRALDVAGSDRQAVARLYERRIWELNADARARE